MKKSIELTEQEANELIRILDLALKSAGLLIADNVLYFRNKLNEAFQQNLQPEKKDVKKDEEKK